MAVMIRMARHGAKKFPFYHVVVIPGENRRNGSFLAKLGTYNPLLKDKKERLKIDREATNEWIRKGAVPSQTVRQLLKTLPN
ncbi:MAG TPA: 30S ribosomal protein S16 [Bdellovibrionota bacterium]|jgi:small subunit ribosomal protein S16|nr:30S ribosomal protein S16 [Bdellovibrionota bacterium]